jgi:threonine dehydratase
VGGGGLLAGIGAYVRAMAPRVRIIGAQSVHTDAMTRSLAAGRIVDIPVQETLADGLAGSIDEHGLDVGRHALDDIVTVDESDIARAIAFLYREVDVVAEGAGAVGVAAVNHFSTTPTPGPAVVVVTGGNIDPERHAAMTKIED